MELLGKALRYEEEGEEEYYVHFQCCNKEEFKIRVPTRWKNNPQDKKIPLDTLIKLFTGRAAQDNGMLMPGHFLTAWERFENV